MRKILCIVILFLIASCGNRNNEKVKVFVFSDYEEGTPFKLWVNDTLKYDGKYKNPPSNFDKTAIYIEKTDTLRTFRIQMLDKDTTFIHDMTGVDKIGISVLSEWKFVIFDSHEERAWGLQ